MLTKIKRIRRKKYATGDVARDFKNIPKAAEPQQGGLGTRNQNIDKFVTDQIKSPELAASAKQSYTNQGVQSNELLSGNSFNIFFSSYSDSSYLINNDWCYWYCSKWYCSK